MSEFDEAWRGFREEVAPAVRQAFQDEAPVDTGVLRDSITTRSVEDRLEVVSTDHRGPIARFIMRGTGIHMPGGRGPYDIYPKGPYPLHWKDRISGADVFAMAVHNHPGMAANPFHQRAWERVAPDIIKGFGEKVGRKVAVRYINPYRNR